MKSSFVKSILEKEECSSKQHWLKKKKEKKKEKHSHSVLASCIPGETNVLKFCFCSLSVNIIDLVVSCGNVRCALVTKYEILVTSTQFLRALANSKAQFWTLCSILGDQKKIQSVFGYLQVVIIAVCWKLLHLIFLVWFSQRDLWGIESQGQLNFKQFVLAMHLMNKTVKHLDPPPTRSLYTVLPSMKTSSAGMPVAAGKAMVGN